MPDVRRYEDRKWGFSFAMQSAGITGGHVSSKAQAEWDRAYNVSAA
ncbi:MULTISPECIES: hypothetical protein [Paenibacillus]|uniref:Uncharacterized protein n=1 Tax=Paenibacillus cineris TaxID=237530 RepID=A0ABQ4LPB9_9BACL|nr:MULTISPECIES: hypothetical protein [Paenibacillus]GIO58351.1 hypothetical protein J21TS7_66690 [Paenibacillus cineris]GIO65047.1 hypothetical protein J43TS9_66210 [Paenibacillus cineris]